MKVEKVKLQTIAGRVVERFPDGAVEDSIVGKEEASQLLRCEEGERIKVVTKKGGYTFKITAKQQGLVFFCHIEEKDEDRDTAEYYYMYFVTDIEKIAASLTAERKETFLTAANLKRDGVRKLKKLTRRLKTRTQKESLFWVDGMTEESRRRFLNDNSFKVVDGEITHPRARKSHRGKLLEHKRAVAGRSWWRKGGAEAKKEERKWYR